MERKFNKRKKLNIRRDDNVIIIAGNYKGSKGKVKAVLPDTDRVIIQGVNIVKRHSKPTAKNPNGGILEKEAPIHISNVMIQDARTNTPTRVGKRYDEATKKYVRVAKKSDELI